MYSVNAFLCAYVILDIILRYGKRICTTSHTLFPEPRSLDVVFGEEGLDRELQEVRDELQEDIDLLNIIDGFVVESLRDHCMENRRLEIMIRSRNNSAHVSQHW
jgi:hypothetical protein